MVLNGVAPTRTALATALQAAADGGVTAFNLTAANQDDYPQACSWIQRSAETIASWRGRDGQSARLVRDTADLRELERSGDVGVIFGTQDAGFLEEDTEARVGELYDAGVRIVQLTYQRANKFGSGCGEEVDGGLTPAGRELVGLLGDAGIAIDLSHVGARTIMETIETSARPPLLTHINLYELNPLPRNKRAEQLRAIVANGGVVGVTAIARFMKPDGGANGADLGDLIDQLEKLFETIGVGAAGIGLDIKEGMTEEEFVERRKSFFGAFPELMAGQEFTLDHYYCSDVNSMSEIPRIAEGLRERGYSQAEIDGVLGDNLYDYLDRVWVTQGAVNGR